MNRTGFQASKAIQMGIKMPVRGVVGTAGRQVASRTAESALCASPAFTHPVCCLISLFLHAIAVSPRLRRNCALLCPARCWRRAQSALARRDKFATHGSKASQRWLRSAACAMRGSHQEPISHRNIPPAGWNRCASSVPYGKLERALCVKLQLRLEVLFGQQRTMALPTVRPQANA